MKVDLLGITRKFLYEDIRKPTAKEKKEHKDSKLHYVVVGEGGKVLGYIDAAYVEKLSAKEGKKYSPIGAAKRRLSQVEHFKNEEYSDETKASIIRGASQKGTIDRGSFKEFAEEVDSGESQTEELVKEDAEESKTDTTGPEDK